MSKGPGRIERAIANILDTAPDNAFTSQELCERIYRADQKKHRIAVIRAGKNLMKRRDEIEAFCSVHRGGELVFARRDHFASYAMAQLKALYYPHRDEIELRAELQALLAGGGHPYLDIEGWRLYVELFIANRDGDTEKSKQLALEYSKRRSPRIGKRLPAGE